MNNIKLSLRKTGSEGVCVCVCVCVWSGFTWLTKETCSGLW